MSLCPDFIIKVSVQFVVLCVLPYMHPLSGYVLGQLQRGLLQMAASLGPISSSVRVVGGQEVSEACPALAAGALGLTRKASSLRMAGGGVVGGRQHRPLFRSCCFLGIPWW